jgi:hypothetical protein
MAVVPGQYLNKSKGKASPVLKAFRVWRYNSRQLHAVTVLIQGKYLPVLIE